MKDFGTQFDSPLYKSSDRVDIDDSLDIVKKKDIGINTCNKLTKDISTDPLFQNLPA
jgi:hypothetical protein